MFGQIRFFGTNSNASITAYQNRRREELKWWQYELDFSQPENVFEINRRINKRIFLLDKKYLKPIDGMRILLDKIITK